MQIKNTKNLLLIMIFDLNHKKLLKEKIPNLGYLFIDLKVVTFTV